jgi:hypothetical protein
MKKERDESMTLMTSFSMFFAKKINSIFKLKSSSSIKHPIKGDGSFFPLALGSWIFCSQNIIQQLVILGLVLNASNDNKRQNVNYNLQYIPFACKGNTTNNLSQFACYNKS